jgi:hypothetical protein
LVRVACVDERVEEVVPRVQKLEECDRGYRRLGQGDYDPPQYLEVVRSLDSGRIRQLLRDRHEELSEQEDRKCVAEEARDDQRLETSYPMELNEDHVQGNARHLRREHHRGEYQHKDHLSSSPLDP